MKQDFVPDFIQLEHFAVTREPMLEGKDRPPEVRRLLQELHDEANHPRKNTISRLKAAMEQYPHIPQFGNYLSNAYRKINNEADARKTNRELLLRHPDYLFARLAEAEVLIKEGFPEAARKLLGEDLELHLLYPEQHLFHITEVASYYSTVANYYLAKKDLSNAEKPYELLKKVAPDLPHTEVIGHKIITERLLQMGERGMADKKRTLEPENFPTVEFEKSDQPPLFNHPEIKAFYEFSPDEMPEDRMRAIMALPRTTLVQDLIAVLEDSIRRYEWFQNNYEEFVENEQSFSIHAVYFLGALEAGEGLQAIFNIFRQGEEFLEYWYSDMFSNFFQEPVNALGWHNLPALKAFVLEKNIWWIPKTMACEAVEQLAMHQPEQRAACLTWFREVLTQYLDNVNDADFFDSNVVASIHSSLIALRATELLPLIERSFAMEIVPHMVNGDLEEVRRNISEPWGEWEIKPMPLDITEYYSAEYTKRRVPMPIDEALLARLEDPYENRLLSELFGQILDKPASSKPGPVLKPAKIVDPIFKNASRNEPCPCGSGKKYKRCHGKD
ncbi:MAG TPA: DUF1186 domain-containing protein [Saprospiraceae bacterium]|nr:DUF1186 domain-containing protein [Saprospiraceae bacterium]